VFAYDQRGHGDAETAAPLALALVVADLRSVADSIGTVAAVVGEGWGGAVALAGGPKIARALVLVDPMIRVVPGTVDGDAEGWDLRDRLAALKIPTTLLLGSRDSAVAPDDMARLGALVRVETLEAGGPSLPGAFERFAEAVREAVPA
jgi:pimeloyl-ACP methyl ester carboxylesterase